MNKMDKCAWAEARLLMWAAEMGYMAARPIHHAVGYDFVVNMGSSWMTVQVKRAYASDKYQDSRLVSLRRCNEKGSKPYADRDFDYLFVADDDVAWLFPWSEVRHIQSNLTVSSEVNNKFRIPPVTI